MFKVLRRPVESAQYASHDFQRRLASYEMRCSMCRKGNCWDTQCGVVVKATPASPFVMTEPELLFDVLIVVFDAPAHPGHEHKLLK